MSDGSSERPSRDLVVRAQRGDRGAFAELIRRSMRSVYVIALGQLGRPQDAEDAAQDACVQAMLHIAECRDADRFSAWLFTIARNVACDLRDRRRLRDVPKESSPREIAAAPADVQRRDLLGALDALGEVEREVLLLSDLEGWSHREIADALGISEVASRQHVFVARRKVRERLGASS